MYESRGSSVEAHKSFPMHYSVWEGEFLKRIVTFFFTKYNKNNMCHSDVQKHVTYGKWFINYKYFVYRITQKVSDTLWLMGAGDF